MDWFDKTEIEWPYRGELDLLRLSAGEIFQGDATLAMAKALLESGVSYIGGYQGAPAAYIMDSLAEAGDLLDELGVHFQACGNEASAAAMLGASINYPLRGAAIWKSVAGTGVASDALANLATAGVKGGALILIGVDFGEGSNVGQERTQATAMKSQIWLMDPRPDLSTLTRMVRQAFELSEASNTPVMLEFRIRASHVTGEFECRDNRAPTYSAKNPIETPDRDYARLVLPPATFTQERHKIETRLPAAQRYIVENNLNEVLPGRRDGIGIIAQGGLTNSVLAGLRELGLADVFGETEVPVLVLNVTYPLVPQQLVEFCAGKTAVLVVEEGQPDFIEQALNSVLRKADLNTAVVGKGVLPEYGECTPQAILDGLWKFLEGAAHRDLDTVALARRHRDLTTAAVRPEALAGENLARPPGFCTGCPERPVFSALKLLEREIGPVHLSADIGCHLYSTLPPFDMGHTVLGYGLGLASSAGVEPAMKNRVLSSMGDGAFWHNGLNSSIASAVFNEDDSVLMIFDNGYTASTGAQHLPSSPTNKNRQSIEDALRGVGVKWIENVRSYDVARVLRVLRHAMSTREGGLKVIIAEGACQLAVERRSAPARKERRARGLRTTRVKYGVDEDVCTGDHSCIRLSGCPSLSLKPNPDPLRDDPVVHVEEGCVGCGLCGEVAHAAVLCPSFYEAEVIRNPNLWDRGIDRFRRAVIGALAPRGRHSFAGEAS